MHSSNLLVHVSKNSNMPCDTPLLKEFIITTFAIDVSHLSGGIFKKINSYRKLYFSFSYRIFGISYESVSFAGAKKPQRMTLLCGTVLIILCAACEFRNFYLYLIIVQVFCIFFPILFGFLI